MPLCPQITNTPITVTQTADFTVSSVVPLIADSTDGLANNIESIEILADGKTKVYRQAAAPTGAGINDGDLWIDTDDGNKLYVRASGVWVTAQDAAIGTAQTTANNAATAAGNAQSTATTALANAATAYSAAIASLQPSANTIVNASNQITAINGNGITVYSGASATTGARVVLNSLGLAGFDSSSTGPSNGATFSISASTGAAVFSGSVTGATITGGTFNIAGKTIIDGAGLLTGTDVTLTGDIRATAGYFGTVSNGFSIGATGLTGVGTGAITGGVIQTSSSGDAVVMSGTSNSLFFKYGGSVYGHMMANTSGNVMIHYGSTATPAGTAYPQLFVGATAVVLSQSVSRSAVMDSTGLAVTGNISSTSGVTVTGAPIYTGDATSTPSTQTEGISLTQGGTVSARRSNNNPLNLHIFDVTAGSTTSVPIIQFIRNGTNRGTLEVFGNTTAPTLVGSSDYRLKENIRDYTESLDKLLATKVRVFNEVEDVDHNDVIGFVAHEFAEVFPNMVNGEKDAVDIEGNPIYQKLGYTNLIPHLVGAIQALHKEVQTLKGE